MVYLPLDGVFKYSQKHLRCLGSRLVVETAWERYARDESADGTVMLPCYVWSCRGAAAAGRETETKLPCYLQLLGVDVGERDCGDESADAAVGGRCGGARLRRRICGRCCSHAICGCWAICSCWG